MTSVSWRFIDLKLKIYYFKVFNNIFLAKINQINYENLKSTNENIQEYLAKTNIKLIDDIYSSYDTSLNTKYEVKIFNNNIDRLKDYFK